MKARANQMICEDYIMSKGNLSTIYDDSRNAAFIPDEEREIAAFLSGSRCAVSADEAAVEQIPCGARVLNPDEWNMMQSRMTDEERAWAEYEARFDRV